MSATSEDGRPRRPTIPGVVVLKDAVPNELVFQREREAFLISLPGFGLDTPQITLIMQGYDVAEEAHSGQENRKSGKRAFSHLRGTVDNLLAAGVRDPGMIVTGFLHDLGEDTDIFADRANTTNSERNRLVFSAIAGRFNPVIAGDVVTLTRPLVDGVEFKSEDRAIRTYVFQFRLGSIEAIIVKIADRLHNLVELMYLPVEDQLRILAETEVFFIPVFQLAQSKYPNEYEYLMTRITAEVKRNRARLRREATRETQRDPVSLS